MKLRKLIVTIGVMSLLSMGFAACSSDDETAEKPTTTSAAAPTKCDNTIVDVAVGNPDFSTLVAAVTEAGLVDTLNGEGPFTVFAPTNEAFAKIPAADLDAVLADKEKLTSILTFHVVGGKVLAADLKPGSQKVVTVNGEEAEIVVSDTGVTYAGGKVVTTDIETCNGVIHVIDTVAMPMG